jgi:hypothetical protein
MYRSDGMTFTCNSDADVASLPTTPGATWASQPWSPASYISGQTQSDYSSILAANAALSAQVATLEAQINTADQALNSQA